MGRLLQNRCCEKAVFVSLKSVDPIGVKVRIVLQSELVDAIYCNDFLSFTLLQVANVMMRKWTLSNLTVMNRGRRRVPSAPSPSSAQCA